MSSAIMISTTCKCCGKEMQVKSSEKDIILYCSKACSDAESVKFKKMLERKMDADPELVGEISAAILDQACLDIATVIGSPRCRKAIFDPRKRGSIREHEGYIRDTLSEIDRISLVNKEYVIDGILHGLPSN